MLVLYGDVPLIGPPSLQAADRRRERGRACHAVRQISIEAAGYGRIVRDADGQVRAIVEHKDASADELQIREANSGLMAAPAGRLRDWLLGLGTDNSQREYYLTDVVGLAVKAGDRVEAVLAPSATEVLGVNDKIQLAEVEACYRMERARELMLAGATLADPARIDVRGGEVAVERDVFIDVNAVFIGKVHLAARVEDRAQLHHQGCQHRRGYRGVRQLRHRQTRRSASIAVIGPFARLRPRHGTRTRRAHRQFRRGQEQRDRAPAARPII